MSELRFTKTHEWARQDDTKKEEEGLFDVGITNYAQALLGDLVYVELPEEGTEITAGKEIGVVESVKAASDFYAPISGQIIAINESLKTHPEQVNKAPYGNGWLVKIKAHNPKEFNQLLNEEAYQQEIAEKEDE